MSAGMSQDIPLAARQAQPKSHGRTQGALHPPMMSAGLNAERGVDRVSPCLLANDALEIIFSDEMGVELECGEAIGPVISRKGNVSSKGFAVKGDWHIDCVLDFEHPVKLAKGGSVLLPLLPGGTVQGLPIRTRAHYLNCAVPLLAVATA